MTPASEVAILSPRVVQDSILPKRWKKRGRLDDLSGLDETGLLARAFRVEAVALPAAPLHYLAMTGSDPAGYCLYAYPVHLHARREQLILMAGAEFEPSEPQALALMASLSEHFPRWRIERTTDAMWFIIVDGDPDLETTPLKDVQGENINDHLPRGGDAMEWLKILNELQMLLFESTVNQEREAAGQPPVNSLWFWGGGCLPNIQVPCWKRVVTNDPVALGIGRQAGIETCWLGSTATGPAGQEPDITTSDTLWVYSGSPSPDGGTSFPSTEQWSRLRMALRRQEIETLTLIEPGYGMVSMNAHDIRSWLPWR